jgi:hypothetical protein
LKRKPSSKKKAEGSEVEKERGQREMSSLVLFFFVYICLQATLVHSLSMGIVTYLYNESDILPYWLDYHTSIAGIKNVAVIDNQSPLETQLILNKWKKKGLKVISNTDDYILKGNTTYNVFKKYFSDVQFAIPLDADEFFVAVDSDGVPMFSKHFIYRGLNELAASRWNSFSYVNAHIDCNLYGNETIVNDRNFYEFIYPRKRFFRMSTLTGLDHGNHRGYYKGQDLRTERFGMLHFHNRNLQIKLQRALKDLGAFHFMNITENINENNIPLFKEGLQSLIDNNIKGAHKAREVLSYADIGWEGIKEICPGTNGSENTRPFRILPTVPEMIRLLKSEED